MTVDLGVDLGAGILLLLAVLVAILFCFRQGQQLPDGRRTSQPNTLDQQAETRWQWVKFMGLQRLEGFVLMITFPLQK
jgi:hypothetical protein